MTLSRLACAVPFCRRTTAHAGFSEWICGDHWRLTDRRLRQAMFRRRRLIRRGVIGADRARQIDRADKLWVMLKRQAIERAMGVRR